MGAADGVEQFFDTTAPSYEQIVSRNGWPPNDMLRETAASLPRVDLALDLGAGTGLTCDAIYRAVCPRAVVAVDVSQQMLEQLHGRFAQHAGLWFSRMAVDQFLADVPAAAASAAIRDRLRVYCNKDPSIVAAKRAVGQLMGGWQHKVDLVTAIGLLPFLPDPQPVIRPVSRILSGRGRFIFTYDPFLPGHPIHGETQTTYDLTVYRSAPQEIDDALQQSGLAVVSHRMFAPQPHGNTDYRGGFVVARKD